jgi:PAS domain S-box-containing protein
MIAWVMACAGRVHLWAARVFSTPFRMTLLVLCLLLPGWWQAGRWYEAIVLSDLRTHFTAELDQYGDALMMSASRRLACLDGLKAFVESQLSSRNRLDQKEFRRFAAGLYGGMPGIRYFAVAPGGINRYVYPLAGNENVFGGNALKEPRLTDRAGARRAIQSGRITLSGPYEVLQGDLVLIAFRALYRDGAFWGMVSLALDVPRLLKEVGLGSEHPRLDFALRDETGHVFSGHERVFQGDALFLRIELPEGSWTLAALPARGWRTPLQKPLFFFRLFGLVVVGLLTSLVHLAVSRQAAMTAAVRERTQQLEQDIARRRAAEEALRLSQLHFANIVESSEDAIISFGADRRISLFSQGAENVFGYTAAEVLGKPLDILFPPRSATSYARHTEEFVASPEVLQRIDLPGGTFGLHKDGSEFPAEASISKFEMEGQQVLTLRLRDITERMRAEERLHQLAAIVESSDDAITSLTLEGAIANWNPGAERLLGYAPPEVIGRAISLLVPPDRGEDVTQIHRKIRRGERLSLYETVFLHKDGTPTDVSLSLSSISDREGRIVGASMIAHDITGRKRLEARIRQAQKMEAIGTMAGGVAHDFNNILSTLAGYTEIALDTIPPDNPAWQHLQEVLAASRRARDLVRQILLFSRQREQERKPVALHSTFREVMRLMRASLPATIEIRLDIDPGSGVVLADVTQMHQLLMNLCTNAEHAMRERGGTLEVQVKAVDVDPPLAEKHPPLTPGRYVRLMVRDTGRGMDTSVKDRIFDPFFTTKPAGEGTGLGLAVVHGIVVSHGGAIAVDSAPGRGAQFEVYLPQCQGGSPGEVSVDPPIRTGRERILFVDDEISITDLWEKILTSLGYKVAGYLSSIEALNAFRAAPDSFDLVITDQTMPQMTGGALAKELLAIRPDLPIILCTGYSHVMTEEMARAIGIQAYLMKPITRRDLSLAIRQVFDQRAARPL